ncbi:MAG: DUF3012 domain-containing protein [Gammaproteobacteria bacterium]|nr:DUF3012 domain-containing protein [Gammaproteobacteria bacterium]
MTRTHCLMIFALLILGSGCAPEVGSDAWCEAMLEKDKGDWTANEATEFASNCIFKSFDDD